MGDCRIESDQNSWMDRIYAAMYAPVKPADALRRNTGQHQVAVYGRTHADLTYSRLVSFVSPSWIVSASILLNAGSTGGAKCCEKSTFSGQTSHDISVDASADSSCLASD